MQTVHIRRAGYCPDTPVRLVEANRWQSTVELPTGKVVELSNDYLSPRPVPLRSLPNPSTRC